ncbi:hypothetical protein [Flindersiella endophytica]
MTLLVVGLIFCAAWTLAEGIADDRERRELEHRQRQAEAEILAIAQQAQMAILSEAMRRQQNTIRPEDGSYYPPVIQGEWEERR